MGNARRGSRLRGIIVTDDPVSSTNGSRAANGDPLDKSTTLRCTMGLRDSAPRGYTYRVTHPSGPPHPPGAHAVPFEKQSVSTKRAGVFIGRTRTASAE